MRLIPLTLKQANAMVERLHRHHKPVRGHRFSIGLVADDGREIGAVIVGRPVSRGCSHYDTAEVTRLVTDGTKNACSKLYAAAARAAEAMGFKKIQTYILEDEPGTSLKASGWQFESMTAGGDWNCPSRGGRRQDQPQQRKSRWSKTFNREAA